MIKNEFFKIKLIWCLTQIPGLGIQKMKEIFEKIKLLDENGIFNYLKAHSELTSLDEIFNSGYFEAIQEVCAKKEIDLLSWFDSAYPKNLISIYDPPPILYVKGTLVPEDEMAVAIVGSRRPSTYGARIAERFAYELAGKGMTIVSGFARGIDGEAHRGTLHAKGRTIAVLGSGIDVIYPKEHAELFKEISANGAVISEFPLGTIPKAFNFPQRNRIISGLSRGVLVVEANQRSGSLITASSAAEEGRDVYAIPGPIDSVTSMGTNHLIQNGAKLVMSPEEILEDLMPQIRAYLPKSEERLEETKEENPVLQLLAKRPLSFDELVGALNQEPTQVQSHLIQLELKGAVKRLFGGRYVRS
jgi:DNA processing protein